MAGEMLDTCQIHTAKIHKFTFYVVDSFESAASRNRNTRVVSRMMLVELNLASFYKR